MYLLYRPTEAYSYWLVHHWGFLVLQGLKRISTVSRGEGGFATHCISGFAIQCLGSVRDTNDVDIEIDLTVGDLRDPRAHVIQILTERDGRFSLDHLKVFFTPTDHPEHRVTIEMLPKAQLGLPATLEVIRLVNGGFMPLIT
jgi:hypothetical protein